MRGQDFLDYSLPLNTRFFNIFHLYDPIAYRIEPLINENYASLNPVLLRRPSSRNRPTFSYSYYKEQFTSYITTTQLPDISIKFPTLPFISFPPVLEMAKETLNKQFTSMIDSITNVSNMFSSADNSPPKSLKRKRDDDTENTDDKELDNLVINSSHYRTIKPPVSHLGHHDGEYHADVRENNVEDQSNKEKVSFEDSGKKLGSEISNDNIQSSILTGGYASVMSQTVSVLNRIVSPVMEKIPSLKSISNTKEKLCNSKENTAQSSSSSPVTEDKSIEVIIPPEIIDERYDFYIQESLIDNNVHQVSILVNDFV